MSTNRALARDRAQAALAAWPAHTPLFPAPALTRGPVSWEELELFHARLAAFRVHPPIPILWERPAPDTVANIWPFLGLGEEDWQRFHLSFPRLNDLTPQECDARAARIKATVVVAVRAVLDAARQHDTAATGMFLVADLVDALARAWSPSYWAIYVRTPATRIHNMTEDSQKHIRRDLLCLGIDVEAVWTFCTSSDRVLPYTIEQRADGSYRVDTRHITSEQHVLYTAIEEWLEQDSNPGISFTKTHPRLAVATSHQAASLPVYEWGAEDLISKPRVCGEQMFQVSTVGPRGHDLLAILKQSSVLLDVDAFLRRVREAGKKRAALEATLRRKYRLTMDGIAGVCSRFTIRPRRGGKKGEAVSLRDLTLRRLRCPLGQRRKMEKVLRQWDREDWIVSQCVHVAEEVRRIPRPTSLAPSEPWYLPIRADYVRTINGRWQPLHFGPLYVSAKPIYMKLTDDEGEEIAQDAAFFGGLRRRWFKAPGEREWFNSSQAAQEFVSVDVSSSQIQILALLTGNMALYEAACSQGGQGFKYLLAELAWPHVIQYSATQRDGYRKEELTDGESRLVQMVKAVVMRYLYGSTLKTIRRDHAEDTDEFGPGFRSVEAARAFLTSIPGWADLELFLTVTRQAALNAAQRDPYAGFVFLDPFDGCTVRWNPIQTRTSRVKIGSDLHMTTQQPAGVRATSGPWVGEYPVDGDAHGELYRLVSPCLIHRLDGAFSGAVVEAFWQRGITTFFAIHDSWGVPATVKVGLFPRKGHEVLDECLKAAMEDWLPRLETVYEDLLRYLPATRRDLAAWKLRGAVLRWQSSWRHQRRQAQDAGKWPTVRVSRSRSTPPEPQTGRTSTTTLRRKAR